MFSRRRSQVAPGPGVFAEFHEFDGRWFVTGRWAAGSGAALERPVAAADLGKAVMSRIEAARRSPRPLVVSLQEHLDGQREEAGEWTRFCGMVAGVPVHRYRPEKRLVILADPTGMRCHDARHSPPRWEPLPGGPPAALGRALIARIERLPPSWPTRAAAAVALDGATMLVYPRQDIYSAAPVAQVPADASAGAVGSEVLEALGASSAGGEVTPEQVSEGFKAALREAGWTLGRLNAAAKVFIRRTTIGEVFVGGVDSDEDIPVTGEGAEQVGAAVMAQFGTMTSRAPAPPGHHPASFGPKTGWIAIRAASADAVVEALDLRDVRPASWDDGIEAAYSEGVFVGPPVNGWVFAAGVGLLTKRVDPAALSGQLGAQVQLFRTHRVTEGHEWSLAENGTVIRAVRYLGETGEFHQLGEPTSIERSLGLDNPGADISEDDVFAVAGAWSLDPTTLHNRQTEAAAGTWGQLP